MASYKFNFIKNKITKTNIHLDIGWSWNFLGILKKNIGVDVAVNQIKYAQKNKIKKLNF